MTDSPNFTMKYHGGPAYPCQREDYGMPERQGLTKREAFAMAAMQGQLAFSPPDSFDKFNSPKDVAEMSIRFADALLAALRGDANG